MIYASVRFLEEWHSPLTVANFTFRDRLRLHAGGRLLGLARQPAGGLLRDLGGDGHPAGPGHPGVGPDPQSPASRHKSTVQTAIGVRHNAVVQKAQGATGGSFNTREFFHGRERWRVRTVRALFLTLVFPVPILLVGAAYVAESPPCRSPPSRCST
jgi:sulfite dehydrogenase (quinone) subunit SoeC